MLESLVGLEAYALTDPPAKAVYALNERLEHHVWDVLNWLQTCVRSNDRMAVLAIQTAAGHLESHPEDCAGTLALVMSAYALEMKDRQLGREQLHAEIAAKRAQRVAKRAQRAAASVPDVCVPDAKVGQVVNVDGDDYRVTEIDLARPNRPVLAPVGS